MSRLTRNQRARVAAIWTATEHATCPDCWNEKGAKKVR